MPDIFTMTAPMVFHDHPHDRHLLIAEIFPAENGLVFFEPYWRDFPSAQVVHHVEGELKGEGPWKIGDATITVLSCGEPELGMAWQDWQAHISQQADLYTDTTFKHELARNWGATI